MPFPVSLLNVEFPLPEDINLPEDVGEPHEREYAEIINRHSRYVKEARERDEECKKDYNEQQNQHRVLSKLPLSDEDRAKNDAYLRSKQIRALYARKKMIEVNSDAGRTISRAFEDYKEACRKSELAKAAAAAEANAESSAGDQEGVTQEESAQTEEPIESVAGPSEPSTSALMI